MRYYHRLLVLIPNFWFKMIFRSIIFVFLFVLLVPFTSSGEDIVISSGSSRITLVELYSSEGCSSCPPAEEWLGIFVDDQRLWKKVVPVAFHVDYWDKLGWKDIFAKPEFSQRQRDNAKIWGEGRVYTPMFVINGEEWYGWFEDHTLRLDYLETSGNLELTTDLSNVSVSFINEMDLLDTLTCYLSIMGCDIKSDIKSGENEGKELIHQFITLSFNEFRIIKSEKIYQAETKFPEFNNNISGRKAIAAWVTQMDNPKPIQAVGGWIK